MCGQQRGVLGWWRFNEVGVCKRLLHGETLLWIVRQQATKKGPGSIRDGWELFPQVVESEYELQENEE